MNIFCRVSSIHKWFSFNNFVELCCGKQELIPTLIPFTHYNTFSWFEMYVIPFLCEVLNLPSLLVSPIIPPLYYFEIEFSGKTFFHYAEIQLEFSGSA